MPVFISRRITTEKQGSVERPYACAGCSYRAEVRIVAAARGQADGSIVLPASQIRAESEERADAALADEIQALYDLIPCPRCGARSDNAALYRQNTVLIVIGWIFAGLVMALVAYFPAASASPGSDPPIVGPIVWTIAGLALAGVSWHRRKQRIERIARAVEFLPDDESS
ncbi:hypothetical protein [Polyangium mundeleinium]|uniref:Uncharacterized protein n=1 Tax=Polyangium mundeleinium TaxID=2995306 RepID=A0ABT5EGX2_9BACT|nr:hypothetical protein [Polyangium mundeleinium]MDC0740579.1 hypothetical protein [Polyangium mundeleinium]